MANQVTAAFTDRQAAQKANEFTANQISGVLQSRIAKPISHGGGGHQGGIGGISIGTIMLITGLMLLIFATTPGAVLAGKVLIGLAIAPYVIGGIALCCFGKAILGSNRSH